MTKRRKRAVRKLRWNPPRADDARIYLYAAKKMKKTLSASYRARLKRYLKSIDGSLQ